MLVAVFVNMKGTMFFKASFFDSFYSQMNVKNHMVMVLIEIAKRWCVGFNPTECREKYQCQFNEP